MTYTLDRVNGRLVYVDLDENGQPIAETIAKPPSGTGLDYPPGLGPTIGLVQGMADGSEVVQPLAAFNSPGGFNDDAAIINDSLLRCGKTRLAVATYFPRSAINVPPGAELIGAFPTQADLGSSFGAGVIPPVGSVLQVAGPFTTLQAPPPALIQCVNTSVTQQGGQVIRGLSLNMAGCPAGSGVIGIRLHGAVGGGTLRDLVVFRPDGACLAAEIDGVTGFNPDQWRIDTCVFGNSRSGHGVLIGNMPDSKFTNCLSHDHQLDGWNIASSTNTQLIACGAEGNRQNGFHQTGMFALGEYLMMDSCETHNNFGTGYLFDSTAVGGTALGRYEVANCVAVNDGRSAAGILAGFYNKGCKSTVNLKGVSVMADGTGPFYGARQDGSAFGMFSNGGHFEGVTAQTFDDGTNTHAFTVAAGNIVNSVPF